MSILGEESITLRRRSGGSFDSEGMWGDETITDSTILASVQPLQGQDRELLPEGKRQIDGKKLYTTSEVRTDNQHDQTLADQVVVDGVVYEVVVVRRERSIIAHYKVFVTRLTESS